MNLSHRRFTITMLVVLLIVTLGLVAGLFVVDVRSVQAGTCGTVHLYNYYCKRICVIEDYSGCGSGIPRIRCELDDVERLMNPDSNRFLGGAGAAYYCQWVSPNCPTFCSP